MKVFSLPPLSVSPYSMFLVVLRIIKGGFPVSPVVKTLLPMQGVRLHPCSGN